MILTYLLVLILNYKNKKDLEVAVNLLIIMKKLGILLILVGVVFFSFPKISELFLLSKNQGIVDDVSSHGLAKNANLGEKNFDQSKVKPIDINGAILNAKNADMSKVVGQLTIPSINKNIAIFDGLENNNLMFGACTMKPNQRMGLGNYAIAGHYMKNEKLLFGGLMNVRIGDKVKLTNKKNIYEYTVFKTLKVKNDRLDLIQDSMTSQADGKAVVSLMSCYYDDSNYRYFVFGKFDTLYPYSADQMLKGIHD